MNSPAGLECRRGLPGADWLLSEMAPVADKSKGHSESFPARGAVLFPSLNTGAAGGVESGTVRPSSMPQKTEEKNTM